MLESASSTQAPVLKPLIVGLTTTLAIVGASYLPAIGQAAVCVGVLVMIFLALRDSRYWQRYLISGLLSGWCTVATSVSVFGTVPLPGNGTATFIISNGETFTWAMAFTIFVLLVYDLVNTGIIRFSNKSSLAVSLVQNESTEAKVMTANTMLNGRPVLPIEPNRFSSEGLSEYAIRAVEMQTVESIASRFVFVGGVVLVTIVLVTGWVFQSRAAPFVQKPIESEVEFPKEPTVIPQSAAASEMTLDEQRKIEHEKKLRKSTEEHLDIAKKNLKMK